MKSLLYTRLLFALISATTLAAAATPAHAQTGHWTLVEQWQVERGYRATQTWFNTEDARPGARYAVYARAPRDGQAFSVTVATEFENRDGSFTESWDDHDAHHPVFARVTPPNYPTLGWKIDAWVNDGPPGTIVRLLVWNAR